MKTILLVEKDAATLVARALILRCCGYTVLEVGSRGEAWYLCNKHEGLIHLILADAILEGDSTIEFVARLQLIYPQIRALFVYDASSAELASGRSMPCEYAVLRKPFRADALTNTINELLEGPKARAVSPLS